MRRRSSLLLAPLAALALAGCGPDEEEYRNGFRALEPRLQALGSGLDRALGASASRSDVQAARSFDRLADRMRAVRKELAALEPPGELEDEHGALSDAIDESAEHLAALRRAAARRDPGTGGAAASRLLADSLALREAGRRLSAAVTRTARD